MPINFCILFNEMYFIIINKEEVYHWFFHYEDGLNVLKEEFNDDPNQPCSTGGFYFTDAANILMFLENGFYLREITLPTNNPDFKMIKLCDQWRANMIILGKRWELSNVDTFKYLIEEKGANVHVGRNNVILRWVASGGHVDILKYLVEKNAYVNADYDLALGLSAQNGHLSVVEFLVESGANVHYENNYALRLSAKYGHSDIVKFLVEKKLINFF